jgi:hypothetical protein
MDRRHWRKGAIAVALAVGCGGEGSSDAFDSMGSGDTDSSVATSAASDGDTGGQQRFDVAMHDIPFDPPGMTCTVVDGMDAVGECTDKAPPDSFDPEVQWSWNGSGGSAVTPLVANLTDDNGDGFVDLCDTPDVVVLSGQIHVLDGATGNEHYAFGTGLHQFVTPAIGDIDGDGFVEIVAGVGGLGGVLGPVAIALFERDGTLVWQTEAIWQQDQGGAIAIADMDNDGSPEIIADGIILSADGDVLFQAPAQQGWSLAQRNTATVVADLDGDGDGELILGQSAYHHDGTLVYENLAILPGYPQIANLDDDSQPEIIITNDNGITVLEHDGTVKFLDMRPTGDPAGLGRWFRPATVHDFDGDGLAEIAVSSASSYSVFGSNLVVKWSAPVQDGSGWAAGTAFDFLGDGGAEAMYADEVRLFVFGDDGVPVLTVPRSSRTLIEYPVVADVDNDGSAEIVVVSSMGWDDVQTAPTVQVIRDREDRWIQARRIWNQHTYHVTNVREDGTIPAVEPPSWQHLNTYRTNAQIENGVLCTPPPVG